MDPLLPLTLLSSAGFTAASAVAYRHWIAHRLHARCGELCHRIAHELTRHQEPHLVMERLFRAVLEHTNASIGILSYRLGPEEPLTVVQVSGLPDTVLKPGTRLAVDACGWDCGGLGISGGPEIVDAGLRETLGRQAGVTLDRRQNMLCIPVATRESVRGLLQLVSAPRRAFTHRHFNELGGVGMYLDAAINNARTIHTGEHELAAVAERQRLSNELHDNMAQVINGLSLELHAMVKLAQRSRDGAALLQRLRTTDSHLDDAKAAIRHAIFELRLPEDKDLWSNLLDFCQRFESWHDLNVHPELPATPLLLPLKGRREVLRVVQEALWNVCKHASTDTARVIGEYTAQTSTVRVTVTSKGRSPRNAEIHHPQGIATMRDRAVRLDGRLLAQALEDGGFSVALEFDTHGSTV